MFAEKFYWLRVSAQCSHRMDDASNVVIEALGRAEMDVEYKPLDDLLA